MLSIVATLNELYSMLLGANVHVFTDYKNLTLDSIKTQHVLRWQNQVKEHSHILNYIEGLKNILQTTSLGSTVLSLWLNSPRGRIWLRQ